VQGPAEDDVAVESEKVVTSDVVEVVPVEVFCGLLFRLKLPRSVVVPLITVVNVVVAAVVNVVVPAVVEVLLTPPWFPPLPFASPGTFEDVAELAVEKVELLAETEVLVVEVVQVIRPFTFVQSPDVWVLAANAGPTSNAIVDSRAHEVSSAMVVSNTSSLRIRMSSPRTTGHRDSPAAGC
jgi:hypothetical protein